MKLFRKFMRLFAVFFGLGYLTKAPGTVATLATVPIVIYLSTFGPIGYMVSAVVLSLVAIFACEIYEQDIGGHDHPETSIDEVVGFVVTMTWLPMTWQALLIGFVLFRILDIWKPLFIGYLDRNVEGGVGVIIDDVAAGIVANIALQALYSYTSLLGVQSVIK